jgi:predicted dehydrogenase
LEPIDLILVGCGLMGGRHLRGYAALERVRPGSLRLRAVCDPRPGAAGQAAEDAEALLGYRPRACGSAEGALDHEPGILAADVATDPRSHPAVVIPLLEAGVHVQVEKPLAVTIARGQAMLEAAHRSERVLAVAENYRRDPMNRLLRHVVESGAIGSPHFLMEIHVTDGRRVLVSAWRHAWAQGGLALDVGVHYADMLEYLLGPVATVCAQSRKVRETREWTAPDGETRTTPVECDDLFSALLTFQSGVHAVWVMDFGSAGERQTQRTVHGSAGMVMGPPDRSGAAVRVQRRTETLEGEALVAALPGFHLNDTEARLFGERPGSRLMEFREMDASLLAAETADFLDAVREGRVPEVSGETGIRAVALVMALLESAAAGEPVGVEEVLSGEVHAFQDRIEQAAG